MNRKIGIVVGLAALGMAAYLGNRLAAQQPNYAQPNGNGAQPVAGQMPPMMRIAVLNLGQVIKNYQKWKNHTTALQSQELELRKVMEQKRAELVALQNEATKPETSGARKDDIERKLRDGQRQLQDMGEDAKMKLGKMQLDNLTAIYKEIEEAVKVYARAKNLEMLMHYNGPVGQDLYLPEVFQRRLANNACIPVYVHPQLDITEQITMMLNQRVQASMPQTPAPVAGQR